MPLVCLSILQMQEDSRREMLLAVSKRDQSGALHIRPHWAQPGSFCVSVPSHEPGKMWVSTEMLNEGMNYISLKN